MGGVETRVRVFMNGRKRTGSRRGELQPVGRCEQTRCKLSCSASSAVHLLEYKVKLKVLYSVCRLGLGLGF